MDPTFGVFSYNPTFRVNVGRPGLFDCENDYPYAQSLGFGDIDIRYFLQYVYTGLVDECMKAKLEDPNWGRIPDFRVEVTSKGCPDPCEGVECPEGQICKDGKCIDPEDPCANVDCPDGFVCVNGECVPERTKLSNHCDIMWCSLLKTLDLDMIALKIKSLVTPD